MAALFFLRHFGLRSSGGHELKVESTRWKEDKRCLEWRLAENL
jgi:hypothetical protein